MSDLNELIAQAERALLARQNPDGSWIGEVELNAGPTAQVVMLHERLGLPLPAQWGEKARRYILRTQDDTGGWSAHFGEASDVGVSIECYIGLRLLGLAETDPPMVRARQRIQQLGQMAQANPWTQLYSAVLGILHWEQIHLTPVQLTALPNWWPAQMDDMSYWVKAITVPMALLGSLGPHPPIPLAAALREELGADKVPVRRSSTWIYSLQAFKASSQQHCLQKIQELTEKSGDFGGNTCTAMNVLLVLHKLGRSDEPRFHAGLKALLSYGFESQDEVHVQTCQSHVWDTGFAMMALKNSSHSAAQERGYQWLRDRQILTVKGPWSRNVTAEPGGWCFGNHHDLFPVTDCTAMALLGLSKSSSFRMSAEAQRGIRWLLAMQGHNGGWSAYEKFVRGEWLNKVLKFKDLEGALVDVPKADVSSKVVEALIAYRDVVPEVVPHLGRARRFLLSKRDQAGLWAGNYGVNYIYGTSFSAKALRQIDGRADAEWATTTSEFFLQSQAGDGGWGESADSYSQKKYVASPESSPVQTAWALIGLINSSEKNARAEAAVRSGLRYLAQTQKGDGSWHEDRYLGTVFPGKVYFRYHLYPLYFPLMALHEAKGFLGE